MSFFEKNLAVIMASQPSLAGRLAACAPSAGAVIQATRKGHPGLMVGQNRLTSSVDPVSEGISLAANLASGPVVALGFALGYHLEPLAGQRDLLVWEPDIELLRLSLDARDYSAWLGDIRLVVEKRDLGDIHGWQLFIPKAIERLYPLEAAALLRMAARAAYSRSPRPEQPRVLIIPPLLGGSLEPAYWCGEALAGLGCITRIIPMEAVAPLYRLARTSPHGSERTARVQAPLMRFLGELAVLEAEKFAPDLVLALAQAPLDRRAIKEIKNSGAKTAFWFVEDFRQMRYYAEIAASYDYFFYIQGEEMASRLEQLGANHSYLPVAAHPPRHRPLGLSPGEQEAKGAPVGFMGAGYPNRVQILSRLLERGVPLKIWGVDWPLTGSIAGALKENRYIGSREVVEIYNSCPVVLNLHSSPRSQNPIGGVDFINPRTFEVPACNGFQLVDKVPCLSEFFEPDVDVATFSTEEELVEKACYYLERPGERQLMADRARQKVLSAHTYYHRMEALLNTCLGPASSAVINAPAQPISWLANQAGHSG